MKGRNRLLQASDRYISGLTTASPGEELDEPDCAGLSEYDTDGKSWNRFTKIEYQIKNPFKIFGKVQVFLKLKRGLLNMSFGLLMSNRLKAF